MELASEVEAGVMGVVESVNEASGAVQQSAAGMLDSAKGASTKAEAAGAASERAASNVQTVASAAEELWPSTQEIGRQVHQPLCTPARAAEKGQQPKEQVQDRSGEATARKREAQVKRVGGR